MRETDCCQIGPRGESCILDGGQVAQATVEEWENQARMGEGRRVWD